MHIPLRKTLMTLGFFIFLTPLIACAPAPNLWEDIRGWFNIGNLLFGGTIGTGLGFLIKWGLEQWSLRAEARRKFAAGVTDQISALANDHYWSLANYAGVVAGLLEAYLTNRLYHLILQWESKGDLNNRLDELAEETSKKSFNQLCHLLGLFETFQFRKSNTYLLTDHVAGEICKRLYNTFVASLPQKLNAANLYALEITDEYGCKKRIFDLSPAELTDELIEKNDVLEKERDHWRHWLRNDLGGVILAADSLRAYNELLRHELANLYSDWFKKKKTPITPYAKELALSEWPDVLSEQSVVTIGHAQKQPTLLSPLGAAVSKPSEPLSDRPELVKPSDQRRANKPPLDSEDNRQKDKKEKSLRVEYE